MAEATSEKPSAIDNRKVNRAAFEEIASRLEGGEDLTFEHIGDVFGKHFYMILLFSLMEAQSAARAIDGAMRKLADVKG